MAKIRDRILLGLVAGLAGNAAKNAVGHIFVKRNIAEYGGPARAAGMLVPAHKIMTPSGRIVGWIADTAIGGMLGVATVYVLSFTGKDKAILKSLVTVGSGAWTALYGVLGTMGATKVRLPGPGTVLVEFLTHTVYGAVAGGVAAYLGDEDLFNGKIPWSASSVKIQAKPDITLEQVPDYQPWQSPNSTRLF